MIILDLWAAAAALAASGALGVRAVILKPTMKSWVSAPPVVFLSLTGLSVTMLAIASSILRGAHAGPREAVAYTVLAIVAGVLLWNLQRQAEPPPAAAQSRARPTTRAPA